MRGELRNVCTQGAQALERLKRSLLALALRAETRQDRRLILTDRALSVTFGADLKESVRMAQRDIDSMQMDRRRARIHERKLAATPEAAP
jgi:hypothetical protein